MLFSITARIHSIRRIKENIKEKKKTMYNAVWSPCLIVACEDTRNENVEVCEDHGTEYRLEPRVRTNFQRIMIQLKFHAAVCIRYHADNAEQRVAHRRQKLSANSAHTRPQKGRSTAIKVER